MLVERTKLQSAEASPLLAAAFAPTSEALTFNVNVSLMLPVWEPNEELRLVDADKAELERVLVSLARFKCAID